MITLYDYLPSQNAYKIRLLLNHLSQPYRTRLISIFEGEGQDDDYLRKSPLGAVPAIELEDGRTIAESNAILSFLAEGSAYLPDNCYKRATELIEDKRALSIKTLHVLDRQLGRTAFFAGQSYTIADMSIFAYVHLADEANLPLQDFTHIVRWIDQVKNQDGYLAETYPYSIDPHSAGEL